MIAKIITVGATRINAIDRMRRALDEYYITGIKTTVPFHAAIMRNGEFRDGNYDTGFIRACDVVRQPIECADQAR
jgi:acetyl-CoA carboxylase biotin carboxylase subunit